MNKLARKSIALILLVVMLTALLGGCANTTVKETTTAAAAAPSTSSGSLVKNPNPDDEYYMITFMSGLEYWKTCYAGFTDAAKIFGAKTVYTGAQEFDINQQVTVLEQVIAKKPAGITITCVNAEGLKEPINKAMAAGIPVILFDSDSPDSNRYSIVQTGNENAGAAGADIMAKNLGEAGEVAVLYVAGTPTLEARAAGFKARIESKYPNMKVVASGNYTGELTDAAKSASALIQAHPNLKGIFAGNSNGGLGAMTAVKDSGKAGEIKVVGFDADVALLEAIKAGDVTATVAQGAYNQGYWAMNFLFQLKNELMNPIQGWKENGINPMPTFVDTGVFTITQENVDVFMAK